MALRRVFVENIEDGEATARGKLAHHLTRVARLRPGERVEVSDQTRAYRAVAVKCSATEVRFRVEEALPGPTRMPRLEAALSIVKFPRFEWAIEKLTELGVHCIIPVVAARSDSRLVSSAPKRLARWRRIAFEAAQQSRRLAAPAVHPPTRFEAASRKGTSGKRLLADRGGKPIGRIYAGEASRFLIGPEGGWTAAEEDFATANGCEVGSLGPTVLRAETAAVAMAAICASVAAEGT